jgi:hypothetical protein
MRMRNLVLGACLGLALLLAKGATAQTDTSAHYKLESSSALETGCFGPCLCAVITHPLRGTFDLQRTGVDPLFTYYKVSNVQWIVPDATTNLTIQGSGAYRVGGEFALTQQLTLDLSIGGAPPVRFDSGLVPGGGEFPTIRIDISLHQNSACIDTVMHVDATDPVVTSADSGSDPSRSPLAQAAPNPFHVETEIHLVLPRGGNLDVVIYDIRGRAIRHLSNGAWFAAGPHTVAWDGRRDQGSLCAAGVYFARAAIGDARVVERIIKVE